MKLSPTRNARAKPAQGVALVIVLLTLFALSAMAGLFAYSMKVEMRLAMNTSNASELEWLGRSGVEYAKWILSRQDTVGTERGFHALNQFWAGGPGPIESADNPFAGESLQDIPVGEGRVTVQIEDQERFLNVNRIARNPALLDMVLSRVGADATDGEIITSALVDWIDPDDFAKPGNGAETEYYLSLDPPYRAKNGPIDDVRELLLVRGVTPALFWGGGNAAVSRGDRGGFGLSANQATGSGAGLNSVFCALSSGNVNINTASREVISLVMNGDESLANEVVRMRSGTDGMDGTEDDQPARGGGDLPRLLGPAGPGFQQLFVTQSTVFAVRVLATLGPAKRSYYAIITRAGRDFQTLLFREE